MEGARRIDGLGGRFGRLSELVGQAGRVGGRASGEVGRLGWLARLLEGNPCNGRTRLLPRQGLTTLMMSSE